MRRLFEVCNDIMRDFIVIQRRTARQLDDAEWILATIHDLRKTCDTRMAEVVPMHVLQRWMGHRDISPTSACYFAVKDRHVEKARAVL